MNNALKSKKQPWLVAVFFIAVAVFCYRMPLLIAGTFGDISVEQLLFHLNTRTEGMPSSFIKDSLRELFFKPLIAALLVYLILTKLPSKLQTFARTSLYFFAALLTATGLSATAVTVNLQDSLSNSPDPSTSSDWISEWYQNPDVKKIPHTPQYNLIWIYVESLEHRHIPADSRLLQLAKQHIAPKFFQILPGTQWTLAGMVASQCGIPLMPVGMLGGNNLGQIDQPLQGATCIGDILKTAGYHNEFIGGADHAFAGKGQFLKTHGFTKITGKIELETIFSEENPPKGWWGFSDHTVLKHARERLDALRNQQQPFFLNILTLDTHGPKGVLTPYCRMLGHSSSIDEIYNCSIKQVELFVSWIESTGLNQNSVIVITGDHPFMGPSKNNLSFERMLSLGIKTSSQTTQSDIFSLIMTPERIRHHPVIMNHFDYFPTILSAMHFSVGESRAALGADIFKANSISTTSNFNEVGRKLRSKSDGYLRLWDQKIPSTP